MNQHQLARLDSPASLLPTPTQRATELLQAAEPQARALEETELIDALIDPLLGAATLLGHRNTLTDKDDVLLLAQGVAKMVQRRFPAFNLAEIREAMLRGASGDYKTGQPGEILLVSLPAVADWLTGYQKAARAAAVLASQPAPLLVAGPATDYAAEVAALVAQARATKLPGGLELDMGNVLYDWLKSIGAFTSWRPHDYYLDLRAQEADRVLEAARADRLSSSGRLQYNTFLAALNLGGLPDDHPLSRSVLNACRKRVLREWLMQHASEDTDMPALLAELQARQAQQST